jgi:transcription elongation factor GreA-like protein
MTSLLDDVDERTPRAKLYAKLREAARLLLEREDKKVARLQEIEERVRAKYAGRQHDAIQLVVSSTHDEWADVVDFLENFDDLLPIALHRVHEGAKMAIDQVEEASG